MTPVRKLLLAGAGALALGLAQACSNEAELNPQPLPPQGETTRNPADNGGGTVTDPTVGAGSSGSSGAPAPSAGDGGTDGGDASPDGAPDAGDG